MDPSSLRSFFWSIASILFLFLKFQEYSDSNFPVPGILLDTARNILSLSMLGVITIIALLMTWVRRREKVEEKFKKEEKLCQERMGAKDSETWILK